MGRNLIVFNFFIIISAISSIEWIIRTMLTPKSGLWNDHFNADFAFIFHVIPADTDPLS
jgi:hypothetical protein